MDSAFGSAAGQITPRGAPARFIKVRAFLRMGRTNYWENWLGTLLCWSMVARVFAFEPRTQLLLITTLVASAAAVATGGILDDLQGFRDGSDLINYQKSDPTGLRPMTLKPLLLGWVSEREAIAYAKLAAVLTLILSLTAWFEAGMRPAWVLPVGAIFIFAAAQYSFGIKISYRGAQEPGLGLLFFGTVFLPYALITGRVSGSATAQAIVWATWFIAASVFSNSHDSTGDRHAGRRTIAAVADETWNHRFIVAVIVSSWLAIVVPVLAGWLDRWFLVPLIVVAGLQLVQLRVGISKHDYLRARQIGFQVMRIGVLAFVITNIVTRWT